MTQAKIAVIGGSGLYAMDALTEIDEVRPQTPFGEPSDVIVVGKLGQTRVAFLPRHGRGHRILPTEIPVRANIFALKTLGVEWIISISAVGSLREDIHPLDLVIPDQLIDRARTRASTFFGDGIVAHVGFADPFCAHLSEIVHQVAGELGLRVHRGGTYVVMEGPQFSTKAESNLYRSWGASVIGMTALPEAKLAREAEIHYATVACATDYDCWHEEHESVTVEMIISNLLKNVANAKEIIRRTVDKIPDEASCGCASALKSAIVTSREAIPEDLRAKLLPLIGKYL